MKMCFVLPVALIALLGIGCGDEKLGTYVKLESLRILALRADLPEVDAGTLVTITPYLSDINGGGRSLTYSADACLDPGVGYGATPTCEGSSSRVALAQGAAVGGLAAPEYSGAGTAFTVTVPVAGTIFLGRTSTEQSNGVPYLITYQVSATDGTTVKSFRRIIVSSRATKNSNPTLNSVDKNGTAMTTYPTSKVDLVPSFGAGSVETYSTLRSDGTSVSQSEVLTTTWFISDGEVTYYRTTSGDTNSYTPPETRPSGRNVIFLIVTHDNRGGVSVLRLSL